MAASCAVVQQPLGSWLSTNNLPTSLRRALEEHGAEKAEDLAYLEAEEIDELWLCSATTRRCTPSSFRPCAPSASRRASRRRH